MNTNIRATKLGKAFFAANWIFTCIVSNYLLNAQNRSIYLLIEGLRSFYDLHSLYIQFDYDFPMLEDKLF